MNKKYLFLIITLLIFSCSTTKNATTIPVEPKAPPILSNNSQDMGIKRKVTKYPKNIIFLIGDGMGLSQLSAGIYSNGNYLNLERFFHIGLQKTYCSSSLITDSAAAGTAMACGKKTFRGAIGVGPDTSSLVSILELAEYNQLSTGLVVTSTIVHATPASFVAHNPKRHNYEAIASDFLKHDVDILIGGGIKFFNRRKSDDRNLISELRDKGYMIRTYLNDEMEDITIPDDQNFAYFTADKDPLPVSQGRTYLNSASIKSIQSLDNRSEKGFFLMIEGSQIDWGGHANNGNFIITEMKDFDKTIGSVLDWAEEDGETLVVVTADHETGGFSINKGSQMNDLKMAFTSKKHTATLVPVFAYGPGSEIFQGIYENTEIFYKMKMLLHLKAND